MILRIKIWFYHLWYLPIMLFYLRSSKRSIVRLDVKRWVERVGCPSFCRGEYSRTIFLLWKRPQFRNLFYFRIPNFPHSLRCLCPQDISIELAHDLNDIVGGGVYFEHAFGTRIAAKSIGYGCTFRQLSTFGVKSADRHDDKPIIGNNVDFGVNVTCIGAITIGDNAVIGAGSVVVKDIPANAIAVGNPAKVIGFRDIK